LNKILKDEWGFKGLVMSDWAGVHDTREAALNGLDLEMGTERNYDDFYLAQPYLDGLKSGEFPMAGLDDKVRRNLRVMFATHVLDADRKPGSLNTAAHQAVARRVAEEGIVLLKTTTTRCRWTKQKLKPSPSSVKTRRDCTRTAVTAPASRRFTKSHRSKAS